MNMKPINYHNRYFRGVANSGSGEVSGETVFHYRQKDQVVWATYAGGGISMGTLVATVAEDGALDMRYSHVNAEGELMTGRCQSTLEVLMDGRYRMVERWQWTSGDGSGGESVVEEFIPPDPAA